MLKIPNSSGSLKDLLDRITYRQWVIMAVLFSCFMGLFVFFSLSGVDSNAESAAKEVKVKVVVAKQDIPERTVITEEMLKVIEVPADVAPAGAFSEVSEAADRPTCAAIQQGDILTDKKVFKDVRMAGFTGTIPPNCRAVSVAITDITGVSGFAKAGDYVDIMVVSGKKEDGLKGEVLMQNVLLLGINKTGEQAVKSDDIKKDDSKDKNEGNIEGTKDAMATATLALPLNEALKLAVASQKGTIYLALRPYNPTDIFTLDRDFYMPGDKKEQAPVSQVTPSPQVTRPAAAAPVSAPAPVPARPAAPSYGSGIEVIRGVDSSRVGVN
ncbi:pilus assembly protein CpaB [Selenomonas sp. GACV-9]|uniref:Flp pilus assembly protein CpaB n=1 Tax=Selenomonas sp. GACV-9 TaxID=3158782 RepID=UPI0008E348C7|nr:pilus assembly protein CpaB [Selenomonas ruminantium]